MSNVQRYHDISLPFFILMMRHYYIGIFINNSLSDRYVWWFIILNFSISPEILMCWPSKINTRIANATHAPSVALSEKQKKFKIPLNAKKTNFLWAQAMATTHLKVFQKSLLECTRFLSNKLHRKMVLVHEKGTL